MRKRWTLSTITLMCMAALFAIACDQGDETAAIPAEGRTPGQVRVIATGMEQYDCYQLGQADAAQDRSAGATLQLPPGAPLPPSQGSEGSGTGVIWNMYKSPEGEVREILYWTEDGMLGGAVGEATPGPKNSCGEAYLDGYRGGPFQSR